MLGLHKASFIVWARAMSLHVLAHVLRTPGLVEPDPRGGRGARGARLGLALVSGALCTGLVVALATLPMIAWWTDRIGRR